MTNDVERLLTLALLLLWLDVAKEFDVDYRIHERDGRYIAVAGDPEEARLRNFGSITVGVAAEFWFPKAQSRFKTRARNRRILEGYIQLAKTLDRNGFKTPYPTS